MVATMLETYEDQAELSGMADALEMGRIVHFPTAPLALPAAEDLTFLRVELPRRIKVKNVSYHPEAGRIVGFEGESDLRNRAQRILAEHADRVESFLQEALVHESGRGTSDAPSQ